MLTTGRVGLVLLIVSFATLPEAEGGTTNKHDLAAELSAAGLPVPESLRPQINFWKQVFAAQGDNQVIIHDSEDLNLIYRVVDFDDLAAVGISAIEMEKVRKESVDAEKAYVRGALIRIHQAAGDEASLSEDERRIARLFRQAPDGAVLDASQPDRIRAQRGIKERFGRGIGASRRYLPELERIFRDEGVPHAVTRLALVESCFNVQAYSKVGAAGVWQFMPSTGRLFMRVDDVVDERRDPLIAGRAAARFLRKNYARLGTWPLAITAYNHGPNGIAKAVEATGTTDIASIIRYYRGPLFGFASRNFYPEFIAAVEVEADQGQHFPGLVADRPIDTEWVEFPDAVPLSTALRATGLERETFLDLNPALGERVRANTVPIPRGYSLRVPEGRGDRALALYASMPKPKPKPVAKAGKGKGKSYVVHKVKKGQTLGQIARRYGTTVARIRSANRLGGRGQIRVGQTLRVPTG
jgi:membrane-bound lytic murein transglycosylase D